MQLDCPRIPASAVCLSRSSALPHASLPFDAMAHVTQPSNLSPFVPSPLRFYYLFGRHATLTTSIPLPILRLALPSSFFVPFISANGPASNSHSKSSLTP